MHNCILRNLFAQILKEIVIFYSVTLQCFINKGKKTLFKWSTSMMQKMNQFLTTVPVSLMETPRMDGLLFLAASVSYHVEELLLYQKSCLNLLFQGDNFFL